MHSLQPPCRYVDLFQLLFAGYYLDQQRPRGESFYFLEDTFFAMYGPVYEGELEPQYAKNIKGISGA